MYVCECQVLQLERIANVVCFRVCSKEVRVAEQKLVLLVPSPGPLPSRNLLVGSIKWME